MEDTALLFGRERWESARIAGSPRDCLDGHGRFRNIGAGGMAMNGMENWRLCRIGRYGDEAEKWNGIVHLPTWTYFKIEGDQAMIVGKSKMSVEAEEIMKQRAVNLFYSGLVATHPPIRKRTWPVCRPRSFSAC
jgi:hypothetical protein